jgi:hypothetical protein
MKPYNYPITADYKALNYNIRDDLTSEKQKQANKLSLKTLRTKLHSCVWYFHIHK